MNTKNLLCGLVIASLGLGSVTAFAQPGRNDARQEAKQDKREAKQDKRDARQDVRHAKRDLREARQDQRQAMQQQRHYNAREFRRGQRLPPEYRERTYVVNDWRGHRLSAPPRGHQWVQVGPDYVLTAIATGLIANLIFNQ